MVGFWHTLGIYFVSGIGANLFSSFWSAKTAMGASTSGFGILFGLLSMVIVNWNAFRGQQLEQMRCMLMFMAIIMIVLSLAG